MEKVNGRVASIWTGGITRREVNEHVPVRRVPLEIPFEGPAMNLDLFPGAFLCLALLRPAFRNNKHRHACGNKDSPSNSHEFHRSVRFEFIPVNRYQPALTQRLHRAK